MALTRLGVNNISNSTIANVTALPSGVGGKVLQVVTSVPTSAFSTTSTSLVDTGYSVTITPTATTSKMIIEFSGNWGKEGSTGRNQLQVQTNSSGMESIKK